jgi:hypothetical protein
MRFGAGVSPVARPTPRQRTKACSTKNIDMTTKVFLMLAAALTIGGCGRENILPPIAPPPVGTGAMSTGGAGAAATGSAGMGPGSVAGAPGGVAGALGGAGAGGVGGTVATPSFDPLDAIDRVSLLLCQQPAWGDLRQKALAGALNTKEAFASAVRDILNEGALAQPGVDAFYRWWLGLDRIAEWMPDATLYPEATTDLLIAMGTETTTFGEQVTLAMDGTFQTLLTAPFSYLNVPLANLYGVPPGPARSTPGFPATDFVRTDLPAGVRAGLLTQPALQLINSYTFRLSPSVRGDRTRWQFLCDNIAGPPETPDLDPIPMGTTPRQAVTAVVEPNALCEPCHATIDPIGFAFGGFDVIGRAQTTDNGGMVDTSNLKIVVDEPGGTMTTKVVDGPVQLAALFATDPAAERCYLTMWLDFAIGGGQVSASLYPAADDAMFAAFAASGFNLKEGIVAVLTSDAFLMPPTF